MTQLEKAQAALDKAETAERAKVNKTQASTVNGTSKASSDRLKEQAMATEKANKTLDGNVKDSIRKKVIVERKYSELEHKIFVSTVIQKKGKSVLERFRVPVGVEVELPIEIIAALKDRGIAKQKENKQVIVPEFVITEV